MEGYIVSLSGDSEQIQGQPTRTESDRCALIGAPLCPGTSSGLSKTRAISDQGKAPLGASLGAVTGPELAIVPLGPSRARGNVFDSEFAAIGARHCLGTDYPNPKDRARPSCIVSDSRFAPSGASNSLDSVAVGLVESNSKVDRAREHCHTASSEGLC